MKEDFKTAFKALLALPIGFAAYMIYIHVVSALDGVFTILFGGALIIVFLAALYWFIVNMKDFVVSIFKDDDERNEKGFKKHF